MSDVPLPSSFDSNSEFYEENNLQKLGRRLKEEPLIPLGLGLTVAALIGASRSIRAGDHHQTNRMFRSRIYAQGFTIVALIVGSMYWKTDRQKRKEFEGAVKERKMKERNEAWIKELEARDDEEKEIKAYRKALAEGKKPGQNAVKKLAAQAEKGEESVKEVKDEGKAITEDIKGVGSVVEEPEKKQKGILESVQELVWPSKK